MALPALYDWTGFYIGGHVGMSTGAVGAGPHTEPADPSEGDDPVFHNRVFGDFTQILAGGHIGYNYRLLPSVLVGLEGDVNAKSGHGWFHEAKSRPTSSWDASIRARLGYLVTLRSLVYGTGGFAFGHFSTPFSTSGEGPEVLGGTRTGWTLGAGVQYALDPNWSMRIEYRYTDWGSKTVDWDGPIPSDLTEHRVIAGLTYNFGGPPPLLPTAPTPGGMIYKAPGAVYKAPPPAVAPYGWTGFYIGGQIGASAASLTVSPDDSGLSDFGDFTQVLAGGHVGYDYQITSFVVGVEGDLSAKFGHGWFDTAASRPTSSRDGSIRGRLGYLMTPRSLVYVTGGFAFGRFTTPLHELDAADTVELLGGDRTGWTFGGGIQYALDSNWSARIEYRYTDWGTKTVAWEDIDSAFTNSKLTDGRVLVALSYKLAGPARFVDREALPASWTGLYVGGQIGGSAGALQFGDEFGDFTQVLAGGYVGYNQQVMPNIVLGLESDFNANLGHGFKQDDLSRPTSSWDGSIRGRLGFLATPRSLAYATGGFAFGHFTTPTTGSMELGELLEEHIGGDRSGWTLGGGIEYALDSSWNLRIEYRHTDWGTKGLCPLGGGGQQQQQQQQRPTLPALGGDPDCEPSKLTDDRVAVGLSYKFGWGKAPLGKAPVVARY